VICVHVLEFYGEDLPPQVKLMKEPL
jgi:hypothetical protein